MALKAYESKKKIIGLFLLLPAAAFLALFTVRPLVDALIKSFTSWTGFSANPQFVGIQNYVSALRDNLSFRNSIKNTLVFTVVVVFAQTSLGFLLAYFVYFLPKKPRAFLKKLMYIPVLVPITAVAVMWKFILSPEFGLVNQALRFIGLGSWAQAWLGQYETAMLSVIAVNIWRFLGFTMVLYYVAMLTIPQEIREAAEIDGANKLVMMYRLFLPLTIVTTETNVVISLTGCMKAFDLFFMLTGGGPGTATEVASMVIYRTAFQNFNYGGALAMSILLFASIGVLVFGVRFLLKRVKEWCGADG
ncbi:MAG: sugar ABC transporter permease [Treponema sp.]|jgi:ABC-type sugar transport system permease subunit|nr:sugar ABC transporter permease [Treponema sp.]